MASTPNKNQKIESLVKLVQKRCRGAGLSTPPQRTVLETLMYAALLENATFDKADAAYAVLENYYIDWNEIRVCSLRELADTLTDLPHPEAAAERVRKALQGIFEKTYMFDLEEMRKKGKSLAEHIKTLESMSAGTPYMTQYAAQIALDGHLIPLDEASLRIMRRLNLSQVSSDGTQEICVGLDRVILKKTGLVFAAQLHHFAAGYYDVPDSPELLSQLSAIDPEAVSRSWASPTLASSAQPSKSGTTPVPKPVPQPVSTNVNAGKSEASKPASNKTASHSAGKSVKSSKTPPVKPAVVSKPAKPVKQPAKQTSKPVRAESSAKKPAKKMAKKMAKKTLPIKPADKGQKKPIPKKPVAKKLGKKMDFVKKTSKSSNVPPGKKVLPQKPVRVSLPKKKAAEKKGQTKPVKKTRSVSPSKALRKKKPK